MRIDPEEAGFGLAFPSLCMGRDDLKRDLIYSMVQNMGRDPAFASKQDWFFALAYLLHGRLSAERIRTWRRNFMHDAKWVYYLSLEFLPGRLLKTCLIAQGIYESCRQALADFHVDLEELWDFEVEAPLGNGGLGRLGACLLDSIATLHFAGMGYGIRYEYGMFRQEIEGGKQVEHPENWLKMENPWEINRPNVTFPVQFQGRVTQVCNRRGELECHWSDTDDVIAAAFDIPVVGFGAGTVSSIRLWSAMATTDFNLTYFHDGNYIDAVKEKAESETLSKVLYPSETTNMGRELRLKQEYFLVSASLQDIMSRFEKKHQSIDQLPDKIAIQLNDTHPALAIPELMRLLVDVHRIGWDRAWSITTRTFSYTNHTLLGEALESWPVELMESLLPRHLQIIYEINHRFLRDVMHRHPGDINLLRRVSMIDENSPRSLRMGHLAIVGSHKINGVSRMHTDIMRKTVFQDFEKFFPGRIVNLTNGISQRRWLLEANPALAQLITSRISDEWICDLDCLQKLASYADDEAFQAEFRAVKRANKQHLAKFIGQRVGVRVDAESMFDVHVKRIHEYKRQLLNVLKTIVRYNRIRRQSSHQILSRTQIFAGKAAPGYEMAKLIIQLINSVAEIVNNDPAVGDLLKIVFIPNYNVQTAELIIPAADLSQQISTAGHEASGTGNMKLALNGALTIGTHDGANDEIAEAVGEDNIFLFGHSFEELQRIRRDGYDPAAIYEANGELKQALDMIRDGYFSPEQPDKFQPIFDAIVQHGDYYMLLADCDAYAACQQRVDAAFGNQQQWTRKAILNVANIGRFSADRLVREYATKVWLVEPVPHEHLGQVVEEARDSRKLARSVPAET
jgi:glycogen phosphorylase